MGAVRRWKWQGSVEGPYLSAWACVLLARQDQKRLYTAWQAWNAHWQLEMPKRWLECMGGVPRPQGSAARIKQCRMRASIPCGQQAAQSGKLTLVACARQARTCWSGSWQRKCKAPSKLASEGAYSSIVAGCARTTRNFSCSGQPEQGFLPDLQGTCRDVPSGRAPRYRR